MKTFDKEFKLCQKTLQGSWLQKPTLNILRVKDAEARFENGDTFTLEFGKQITMAGWVADKDRSNANVIYWTNGEMKAEWHFDEDDPGNNRSFASHVGTVNSLDQSCWKKRLTNPILLLAKEEKSLSTTVF